MSNEDKKRLNRLKQENDRAKTGEEYFQKAANRQNDILDIKINYLSTRVNLYLSLMIISTSLILVGGNSASGFGIIEGYDKLKTYLGTLLISIGSIVGVYSIYGTYNTWRKLNVLKEGFEEAKRESAEIFTNIGEEIFEDIYGEEIGDVDPESID